MTLGTIETVAAAFGILSVYLSTRQIVWSWPTALINLSLYAAYFFAERLYALTVLQGVFIAISIYGWYEWLHGGAQHSALRVSRIPVRLALALTGLGAVTWVSTHQLDPYRPLTRIDANRPVPADVKPLPVQVVAMDWKWLFLYPEQGIATVNEVAAPVDRPIAFHITATSVMNVSYDASTHAWAAVCSSGVQGRHWSNMSASGARVRLSWLTPSTSPSRCWSAGLM